MAGERCVFSRPTRPACIHLPPRRRLPAAQGAAVRGAAQAVPGERCDGAGHPAGPPPRVPHTHGAPLRLGPGVAGRPGHEGRVGGGVCITQGPLEQPLRAAPDHTTHRRTWLLRCRRAASRCRSTSLWTATTCQRGRLTHVHGWADGWDGCIISCRDCRAPGAYALHALSRHWRTHILPPCRLQPGLWRRKIMWSWMACASASRLWRSRRRVRCVEGR